MPSLLADEVRKAQEALDRVAARVESDDAQGWTRVRSADLDDVLTALETGRRPSNGALARLCEAVQKPYLTTLLLRETPR